MERLQWWLVLFSAVMMSLSGCATAEEWSTWVGHPSHFASQNHLAFSMKTHEDARSITDLDTQAALREEWWGHLVPDPPMDVTGRWRGTWVAAGIFGEQRTSDAEIVFSQRGRTGTGRLRLGEATAVPGVPWTVRQAGSFGIGVVYRVDRDRVLARDDHGSSMRVTFTRVGDRLYGRFTDAGPALLVLDRDGG